MKAYQIFAGLAVAAFLTASAPPATAETTVGSVLTTPVICSASGSCTGGGAAICSLVIGDTVVDADDCANARSCGPGWREWTAEVDWTESQASDQIKVEILCGGTVKASETCDSPLFDRRQQVCVARYSAQNGDDGISCRVTIVQGNPGHIGDCRLAEPPNPVELTEALIEDLEDGSEASATSSDATFWTLDADSVIAVDGTSDDTTEPTALSLDPFGSDPIG